MHHVVLEQWSRGRSWLHRRDARVKALALLALLAAIATSHRKLPLLFGIVILALVASAFTARIPVRRLLLRACVVLPLTLSFALLAWLGGDTHRAVALVGKSYVSAFAALLFVATTPLPAIIQGLASLRAPVFLLMVAQFVYRYLFVISEEAQHMRTAAQSRGGLRFSAAAGALAVLFARSYARAERIHRAMAARGFDGEYRLLAAPKMRAVDGAFLAAAVIFAAGLRTALEVLA